MQGTSPSPSRLWGAALLRWWIYAACSGARSRGNPSLRVLPTTRGSWELGSALECLAEPHLGQHSPSASSRNRELDGEAKEACRRSKAKSWSLRRWSYRWQWRCEGESATSAGCEGGCQEGGEVASLWPLFFDWFILICEFKSEKIWLPGFDSTLGYPGEGPGRGARLVDDLLSGSLSTGLMFERVFSLAHTRSSRLASFLRSVKQEAALHSFAAFPFRDEPRWSSKIPHVDHSGSSPSLEALFPMPVPFAKDFVSKHKSNTDHRRINLVVLVLSWLSLGRPSSIPASYKVFGELD